MGKSISPVISWVRPNWPRAMKRLFSEMPSSMWRPSSDSSQLMALLSRSSGNSSWGRLAHTPARLIQPPRLVELATSGLMVTTRSWRCSVLLESSVRTRPNICWVDMRPL